MVRHSASLPIRIQSRMRCKPTQTSPELIEQIGIAIGRANVNPKSYPFETEMRPILAGSLESLAEAERHMTERQKSFFRRRLVLFMTTIPVADETDRVMLARRAGGPKRPVR
ncbi:MAG TPA: hypothetical protein VF593_12935 [Chthoniobacteraceae bacterium]|jgi:hypothetical protein